MLRTYQPKKLQRKKEHGFRKRMKTANGRKVLARRRAKGRAGVCAAVWQARRDDVKASVTLKKNSDFHRLYARGKSAVTPYLALYVRKNRLGVSRCGYTVSTKLGGAVVRNRVRRRLREIVRLNAPRMRPGYDVVVVARSRAVGCEYRRLEAAYLTACRKLGLMKEAEA